MYKQFLGCIIIVACSSNVYSACTAVTNPVLFTPVMASSLSDNSYLQLTSQTVYVSSPQPISGCNGSGGGPSTFTMASNTDLSITSTISKDGHTYYQIPAAYITTPTGVTKKPVVYVAFSVKDNQDAALEYWVNSASQNYELYRGTSDTRGIRLQNVKLLISGLGNSEGNFIINNPRLGLMTANSGSGIYLQTANTTLRLSNTTFKITKSTCVINGGAAINVTLPTVRTSDFTSVGQTLGETTFPVNVSGCNSSDVSASLVALLTDNNDPSQSNSQGLLKNTGAGNSSNVSVQIIDGVTNSPISIAPKVIGSSNSFFSFGNIGSGGAISKSFKARYYSNAVPMPATNVNAQATITLIYN